MCGLICEPSPRKNRPFECRCRSLAVYASEHRRARERDRDARAELDALGVLGRDHERQERIAARLRGEQTVVPELLEFPGPRPDVVNDGAMIPVSTFMRSP